MKKFVVWPHDYCKGTTLQTPSRARRVHVIIRR